MQRTDCETQSAYSPHKYGLWVKGQKDMLREDREKMFVVGEEIDEKARAAYSKEFWTKDFWGSFNCYV
jgi:hypothetical protein